MMGDKSKLCIESCGWAFDWYKSQLPNPQNWQLKTPHLNYGQPVAGGATL